VAAAFSGCGGALYAHLSRFITPDDFGLMVSILFITMAIVGGLHSVVGGLVGAMVVTAASEALRAFPAAQPILYGLVLILLVRFMPNGVAGATAGLLDWLLSLRRPRMDAAERPVRTSRVS
jgi:branched-chain amino acid transport system permease protein